MPIRTDLVVPGNIVNHKHKAGDVTGVQAANITDTKDNILALTPTAGLLAKTTDTNELLYADGTDWTDHNHTASNITDFDTEVSNNTDVSANTASRHDPATEGDGISIAGQVVTNSDRGSTAVTNHVAESNPHTQYLQTTTADTTYLKLDATNGPVVGAITFQRTVSLIGTTNEVKQIVRAGTGQTANLTEWQNSSGTVLAGVGSSGHIGIGIVPNLNRVIYFDRNFNDPSTIYGVSGRVRQNGSAQVFGMLYQTISSGGGNATGIQSNVRTINSNANRLVGINSQTTITSGTINEVIGIRIQAPTIGTGSIATMYGVFVLDQTAGTNNYAIYTNAGLNRLGDQLEIDGSQDIIQNIIQGHSTQTANLTEWQNSGGTKLSNIEADGTADMVAYKVGGVAGIDKSITVLDADGTTTHALTFTKGILTECVTT